MKVVPGTARRFLIKARVDNVQKSFCESQAQKDGHDSSAEFVRWLIDEEQKRRRRMARRQQRQTEAQKERGQ